MAGPTTPKVSGMGVSKMADRAASIGMGKLQLNGKGKTVLELASPASTYGESPTGISTPTTPYTPADYSGECVTPSMYSIRAGLPAKQLWTEGETFHTPTVQDVAKIFGGSVKRVASSESLKAGLSPLASFDEDLGYDSEGNSRSAFRRKHGVSFIKGKDNSNDPFVSDEGISGGETSLDMTTVEDSPKSKLYQPRGDRTLQKISAENAQAILPPSSCVFIANLPNSLNDAELQHAVEKVFFKFGMVYVKIKRDARGMPFAFAQYENASSAERAIEEGRGLVINGRQCRTERAKVNRSLYLSASNGNAISAKEAHEILAEFGDLEKVWHCTNTEKQMYNLPEGIWVTFAFFQDARDAQNKFKEIPQYHLENYDHSGGSRSLAFGGTPSPRVDNSNGRIVVEVSGLPGTACPEHLAGLFERFGKQAVTQIEVMSRVFQASSFKTVGFVTFRNAQFVEMVMQSKFNLGGHKLSLKIADPRSSGSHGRVQGQGPVYSGSPSYRRGTTSRPYQHPYARALREAMQQDYAAAAYDGDPGAFPYNGTYGNTNGYYPFNGYPAAGYSYAMPGPTNGMVPPYAHPYFAMMHPPYYPTQHNGAVTSTETPGNNA